MAKKAAVVGNVMDLLGAQAKKTEKTTKKKDELPILQIEDTPDNRKMIDTWIAQKRAEKAAETLRKKYEERLKDIITAERMQHCLTHKFTKAVKVRVGENEEDRVDPNTKEIVSGRKAEAVTAAFQSKCGKIKTDDKPKLEEVFGNDYAACFRMLTHIKLTEAAMKQVEEDAKAGKPTLINKVIEALGGEEKFFEAFEISQEVVATDLFFERYVSDKKLNAKAKLAIERELVKPQGPTLSI